MTSIHCNNVKLGLKSEIGISRGVMGGVRVSEGWGGGGGVGRWQCGFNSFRFMRMFFFQD